jgi:hypothetical protein
MQKAVRPLTDQAAGRESREGDARALGVVHRHVTHHVPWVRSEYGKGTGEVVRPDPRRIGNGDSTQDESP